MRTKKPGRSGTTGPGDVVFASGTNVAELKGKIDNLQGAVERSRRQPDPQIAACLDLLAETFPRCFAVFEDRRRPLKIGIHVDILAAFDGAVTPRELARALSIYVGNRVYRARLRAGAVRIDLDGEPAGVVTPEQEPGRPIAADPERAP